jgi:hypothetical protein
MDLPSETATLLPFGGNPLCVLEQEPELAERVAHIERAPRLLGPILARAGLAPALFCLLCGCSSTLDLGSNDAGVLYDADCKPGTYAGIYACSTSDGSLFAFVPSGPIVVTLVPIGTGTLALAPDASLSSPVAGIDTTSITTLTGVLDCSTRKLKGVVPRVTLSSPTTNITFDGDGEFSATYEPDASPPALIDGVLDPPSLTSTCSWTAQFR